MYLYGRESSVQYRAVVGIEVCFSGNAFLLITEKNNVAMEEKNKIVHYKAIIKETRVH